MACFDNIIALRENCSNPITTSGYYLDDIGISKIEIEQIITKDYSGVQDFIDRKSAFAIQKVTSEIYSYLSPKYKANSILVGSRVGYEADVKELIPQNGYVGIEIKVYNPNSYINFVISDLSLFVDVTQAVPVLIYDLKQGLLLATINMDAIAGQIVISYEKTVVAAPRTEMHLWIGYNAGVGAINSYKTVTHNGCSDCHGYTFSHRYVRATGATADTPFTTGTIESLTHTAGLSFNYSVECNHYDWLCNHRKILAIPFLYKTGVEITTHALNAAPNQRTMAITTVNRELMEQKHAHFVSEYDKSIGYILRNMTVPQDKNCFECNDRIVSKFGL